MRILQSEGFGAPDLLDGWPQDANVVNRAGKALEKRDMREIERTRVLTRENGSEHQHTANPFQLVMFGVEQVSK